LSVTSIRQNWNISLEEKLFPGVDVPAPGNDDRKGELVGVRADAHVYSLLASPMGK
jgi:hypothetical protein